MPSLLCLLFGAVLVVTSCKGNKDDSVPASLSSSLSPSLPPSSASSATPSFDAAVARDAQPLDVPSCAESGCACQQASGCDDHKECTVDQCTAAGCEFSPVAESTPCTGTDTTGCWVGSCSEYGHCMPEAVLAPLVADCPRGASCCAAGPWAEHFEARASSIVQYWITAQNAGDFSRYQGLYAPVFEGVRRSGDKIVSLDRDGWMRERRRMFERPMRTEAYDVKVRAIPPDTAEVSFVQDWRSGSYHDIGDKRMIVGLDFRIVREELLSSTKLPGECGRHLCARDQDPAVDKQHVTACESGCRAGARGDCEVLAEFYLQGRCGLTVDRSKAATLYGQGCTREHSSACTTAGELLEDRGLHDQARVQFESGCGHGNLYSCQHLGLQLLDGEGGPVDVPRGLRLLDDVCGMHCMAPNVEGACETLIEVYQRGDGVAKDPARARQYQDRLDAECGE